VKFRYLLLRLIRHFMPESLARLLLRRRWILQPGLESSDPQAAAERYVSSLAEKGYPISGRRMLVFGYGGRFAIGIELLKQGAAHVVLCDHFMSLDQERNLDLLPHNENYLARDNFLITPRPEFMTLVHGDIREGSVQNQIAAVDCVLSNSVFEHLEDVAGITRALAGLTKPDGIQLHFVDLRDHYFKYPFEMLSYSERVWRNLLNPTSNLNRFRAMDYGKVFDDAFQNVEIHVLDRLEKEFEAVRSRIRPEFIHGDPSVDSAALIRIIAKKPRHSLP
jgi:hypothetical protein